MYYQLKLITFITVVSRSDYTVDPAVQHKFHIITCCIINVSFLYKTVKRKYNTRPFPLSSKCPI